MNLKMCKHCFRSYAIFSRTGTFVQVNGKGSQKRYLAYTAYFGIQKLHDVQNFPKLNLVQFLDPSALISAQINPKCQIMFSLNLERNARPPKYASNVSIFVQHFAFLDKVMMFLQKKSDFLRKFLCRKCKSSKKLIFSVVPFIGNKYVNEKKYNAKWQFHSGSHLGPFVCVFCFVSLLRLQHSGQLFNVSNRIFNQLVFAG